MICGNQATFNGFALFVFYLFEKLMREIIFKNVGILKNRVALELFSYHQYPVKWSSCYTDFNVLDFKFIILTLISVKNAPICV
jgi:hypothetical protein